MTVTYRSLIQKASGETVPTDHLKCMRMGALNSQDADDLVQSSDKFWLKEYQNLWGLEKKVNIQDFLQVF